MAKSAKPAPAPAAEGEAAAKPKSKLIVLAIIGILVLAAAGGGGWFFFMKDKKHTDEPKAAVAEPPTFLALEAFTVNLQRDESEQYLNVGITLKISSAELADKVRASMPEVRSRLLFMLSSKHAAELVPLEGKKKLAREIMGEVNTIIGLQTAPPKIAAHENAPAPGAEATSGVAVAPASGVETPPVAAASAPAEAAPEAQVHTGESGKGVVDVLFTAFIIQ
jgi:flagellar FliL protein